MSMSVLSWRRTDIQGTERLELVTEPDRITASSTVISEEDGGLRLDHHWLLGPDWRVQTATIERWSNHGHGRLTIERAGSGWLVNAERRADLEGADEPDLSVTPFCNTFAIRRVPQELNATLTLDTVYIDGADLTVRRSQQRYDRLGPKRFHYMDLGVARGFEADLLVDEHGLVLRYEDLFERISPK
ncbi:MAG: putative glycolipid-binding domain-containing protein [Blastomonas sp.]